MTTPVPEDLPHVLAAQSAIEATGLAVYLGGAPAGRALLPATYVVLYPSPGIESAASLADDRTGLDLMLQATAVATTPEGAIGTAGRVRRAVAGGLVVDGRVCWRPEALGGPPLQRDDDVTPPLWYLPMQYRIRSITA
ncbi:hypothetical protein ACIGZJ_31265 [Kitasatospora sp. NPDC052868]|uniref:hypothetical protein n=1 Tax=Kitasatospora sp. NPDC052868 TaxID=3364060 RepID=UPI0037CB41E6